MFTEPEVNNCFSVTFRGDYQGLQNRRGGKSPGFWKMNTSMLNDTVYISGGNRLRFHIRSSEMIRLPQSIDHR